ncbi:MAG: NAD(P)/FAD-dependent oxidoreductase [Acetobacteraceae bacterium]|nr:NAD(P)/FAD-dependent oxidoreductase [Acetobacteraceae bacterium]
MNQTTRIPAPGLTALEARLARDLEALNLPPRPWVPARFRGGERVWDVVVIGAGMNGIAAAGALRLHGIAHIRVLEAAEPGREGPWTSFARMDTLRSPKTLPGPCLGQPALTFRAWYEAGFGEAAWDALYKIPNAVWQDYLSWLQRALRLPITHGAAVTRIQPADGLLRVETAAGEAMLARRVVKASGRMGAGGLVTPGFIPRDLWSDLAAHAGEAIDFARLAGKSLAVLGGGASAWDNAATALEQGAAEAHLYIRRAALPQVNKSRGAGFHFHLGWAQLPDADRWDLIAYMHDHMAPPPHETVNRGLRQKGLRVHLGSPLRAARREGAKVVVALADGREVAHDFLIVGTGFLVDVSRIPELAELGPHIARWRDRYTPPPGLEREEMAEFPYLGEGFELLPRTAAAPPELSAIHLFNYGAHASQGGIASDIPGINVAADRLAKSIARDFFRADIAELREEVAAYDEPELKGTPYFIPGETP